MCLFLKACIRLQKHFLQDGADERDDSFEGEEEEELLSDTACTSVAKLHGNNE